MSKSTKALGPKIFDAPGLGYDLEMDDRGIVFRLDERGRRVERIAFRDAQGVWQLIITYPIISNQLVSTLESQFSAK